MSVTSPAVAGADEAGEGPPDGGEAELGGSSADADDGATDDGGRAVHDAITTHAASKQIR
jgi:hypothetical protein